MPIPAADGAADAAQTTCAPRRRCDDSHGDDDDDDDTPINVDDEDEEAVRRREVSPANRIAHILPLVADAATFDTTTLVVIALRGGRKSPRRVFDVSAVGGG